MEIRRIVTVIEDMHHEGGRPLGRTLRRVATAAVIANPAIGPGSDRDLDQFAGMGLELGALLATQALAHLGGGAAIHSFGKAAIVGVGGEIEQAAILIHKEFGKSLREAIGGGKAGIPSTKKVAGPGTAIDVPLSFRDNSGLGTHFDCMEIAVPGAPRHDEIVVIAAFTDGGRPHPWRGWD